MGNKMDSRRKESTGQQITKEELYELEQLMVRFIRDYENKPVRQEDEEWLTGQLLAELPEENRHEAERMSHDAMEAIYAYDKSLASLTEARNQGRTTEEWFADHILAEEEKNNAEVFNHLKALYWRMGQETGTASTVSDPNAHIQEKEGISRESCRILAKQVGRQMILAGLQNVPKRYESGEDGDVLTESGMENGETNAVEEADSIITERLFSENDAGLKAALTGAIEVMRTTTKDGNINIYLQNAPVQVTANIMCVTVENIKTTIQAADGKMTTHEAATQMANHSVAASCELACGAAGRKLGQKAMGFIPLVGRTAGGIIGEAAGKAVGRFISPMIEKRIKQISPSIYATAQKIAVHAKEKIHQGIKSAARCFEKAVGMITR